MRNIPGMVTSIRAAVLLGALFLPGCRGDDPAPAVPAAVITAPPADQSVLAGATASFAVTASHATGYQWEGSADGGAFAAIPGATAAVYTTPPTALADDGRLFRVVVRGAANSVTSPAARLAVRPVPVAPTITVQPADQSVLAGADAHFSVTATGTDLSYQWRRSTDGGGSYADLAGATGAALTVAGVALGDTGYRFQVRVSNTVGQVTSGAALLTVSAPAAPAFAAHPADASVNAGQTAQFSVAATGVPAPVLQWQKSTDQGGTWSDIVGATSSSYTTGPTVAGDSGSRYRAVATNGAGVATSSAATLTVTTSYAWGPAPNLRFVDVGNTTEYAQYVDFAMNEAGDAVAIWLQSDGVRSNLWSNRFMASSKTWGTPQLIETSSEDIAVMTNPLEGPRVAINADGSAAAVWVHAPSNLVWANHFTVAGGWGTAQLVDAAGPGHSHVPRVAIDGSGQALAVWYRYDGAARYNVWASRFTAGAGWGGAGLLENDDTRSAVYPSVAMNALGQAIVAWNWLAGNLTDYMEVSATYYDSGAWGTAVNLSAGGDPAGTSAKPEVGIDAAGRAIVVWKQRDSGISNIRACRYAGGWETSTLLDTGPTGAFDANLAVNASGEALATWIQFDESSNADTWAARFKPDTGWETAALVEGFADPSAISPRAAIDPAGNAMVLMGRISSAQPGRLRANRAPAGSTWSGDTGVDGVSYPGAPASWRLGIDGAGRAMAVWVQEGSGPNTRVYYNRYE